MVNKKKSSSINPSLNHFVISLELSSLQWNWVNPEHDISNKQKKHPPKQD